MPCFRQLRSAFTEWQGFVDRLATTRAQEMHHDVREIYDKHFNHETFQAGAKMRPHYDAGIYPSLFDEFTILPSFSPTIRPVFTRVGQLGPRPAVPAHGLQLVEVRDLEVYEQLQKVA